MFQNTTCSLCVINSRGEREPFSFWKVYRGARKVGASKDLAGRIAKTIEREILPDTKTSEIFKRVKSLLHKEFPAAALRFSLKEGMRKLGPTGFPFEKYIGEIFLKKGFRVRLNQNISGFCCRYEIDFLAQKDNSLIIGECKYRNLAGQRVELKAALSNYARFLDIQKGYSSRKSGKNLRLKSLLVTNTKFTSKTIRYCKCVGVDLLGWNYPRKKGLEYLIDTQKLYPITILPSFKKDLAGVFASKRIMLVEDVLKLDIEGFAKENRVPVNRFKSLVQEARILLRED